MKHRSAFKLLVTEIKCNLKLGDHKNMSEGWLEGKILPQNIGWFVKEFF